MRMPSLSRHGLGMEPALPWLPACPPPFKPRLRTPGDALRLRPSKHPFHVLPAASIPRLPSEPPFLEAVPSAMAACPSQAEAKRVGKLSVSSGRYGACERGGYGVPLVKMCGITNVSDAVCVAEAGAKYVGLVLWPKSRRSICIDRARAVADAVRDLGAEPVGVFVEEDAETIQKTCSEAGLVVAQLHGDIARSAVLELPSSLRVIYVLHADEYGDIQMPPPLGIEVDWILVDGIGGGSGKSFSWESFSIPDVDARNGWILAGGLHPQNVAAAISLLRPHAVDVSSGICGPDGIRKDPARVNAFMSAVRSSNLSLAE